MNIQPQRQTFFGACPHDCPDTCAMVYEVAGRQAGRGQGQQRPPDDARRAVREAEGLPRSSRQSRPADVSAAPDRAERLQAVRAHLLGRGDRRDRQALARDHRHLWQPGDHALFLSRQYGPGAGHQLGRSVLQSPRHDGEREDLLRVGLFDRLAADRRPDRRRRSGKLRAFQVHRHLGVQLDLDQSASLAVRARGAEARRQGGGHRQLPVAHGQGRRLAYLPAARHRRRVGDGHHQLDHRAGAGRSGLCRAAHLRLRGAEGARGRVHARLCREDHRRQSRRTSGRSPRSSPPRSRPSSASAWRSSVTPAAGRRSARCARCRRWSDPGSMSAAVCCKCRCGTSRWIG